MDLYSAIGSLPEKYRTVVILRYFDELKLEEIAYITGIPRGNGLGVADQGEAGAEKDFEGGVSE